MGTYFLPADRPGLWNDKGGRVTKLFFKKEKFDQKKQLE
jgi:hypothetical protein